MMLLDMTKHPAQLFRWNPASGETGPVLELYPTDLKYLRDKLANFRTEAESEREAEYFGAKEAAT